MAGSCCCLLGFAWQHAHIHTISFVLKTSMSMPLLSSRHMHMHMDTQAHVHTYMQTTLQLVGWHPQVVMNRMCWQNTDLSRLNTKASVAN